MLMIIVILLASLCTTVSLSWSSKSWTGCISHHEVKPLLNLNIPTKVASSIDLGNSKTELDIHSEGLVYQNNLLATWDELRNIAATPNSCFALYDDGSKPWQISTLSETTGFPASLCPPLDRSGPPTLVLGGFTMHRIAGENVNPMVDTVAKIEAIRSALLYSSNILDTCMGLGYTAIAAAKILPPGGKLTTIEYDDASLEMCSYNPWSSQLFDGTLPIEIKQGDSCDIVKGYATHCFDCIIHDPPARALCKTNLYGLEFYKQLHRITKPRGKLFHYIGNPHSKESGRLFAGVKNRLCEAGFRDVRIVESAFGLVAEA